MQSTIPNVWIAVGGGAALWMLGQKMYGHGYTGRTSPFARLLSLLGLAAFCLGMYAGFRGPLTIGSITLGTFPFAHFVQKSDDEAVAYSRNHLYLSRQPAVGWHGASKDTLQYNVKNNGNRDLSRLVVRFTTTDGSIVDKILDGPFRAGRTSTAVVEIPARVSRSYFTSSEVSPGEIVGAQF
jgi:hypothetical protein